MRLKSVFFLFWAAFGAADALPICHSESWSDGHITIEPGNNYCTGESAWSEYASTFDCCPSKAQANRRALISLTYMRGSMDLQSPSSSVSDPYFIEMESAFCDVATNPSCPTMIYDNTTFDLEVTMNPPGDLPPCCAVCACVDDPICKSFNGVKDEWVICDGRKYDPLSGSCKITDDSCRAQKYLGTKSCKFLKYPGSSWVSWPVSGSPCQPDWAVLKTPKMTMYEYLDLKIQLELGERGIISAFEMTKGSVTYRLSAESCHTASPLGGAWDGPIPSDWTWETVGSDIWWRVNDATFGVYAEIKCILSSGAGLYRLDIQNLLESDTTRMDRNEVKGFCALDKIEEKTGTFNPDYYKCTKSDLPDLLTTCKKLVDDSCSPSDYKINFEKWCKESKLTPAKKSSCLASGIPTKELWANFVCEANGLPIDDCIEEISQFGWDPFIRSHTNGLEVPGVTCVSDTAEYSSSASTCEEGISVQYKNAFGSWIEEFFIPSNKPPCGGILSITALDHPNLFLYKVRFAVQGVQRECLLQNSCKAHAGLTLRTRFSTNVCPYCENQMPENKTIEKALSFDTNEKSFEVKLSLKLAGKAGASAQNIMKVEKCDGSALDFISVDLMMKSNVVKVTVKGLVSPAEFEVPLPVSNAFPDGDKESQIIIQYKSVLKELIILIQSDLSDPSTILFKEFLSFEIAPEVGLCPIWNAANSKDNRPYLCYLNVATSSKRIEDCNCEDNRSAERIMCRASNNLLLNGMCKSCCRNPKESDSCDGEPGEPCCRELANSNAFCQDRYLKSGYSCDKLSSYGAELLIDLTFNKTGAPCCQTCSCYGDPECLSFNNTYDKWVLCDSRDSSCKEDKEYCGGKSSSPKDHAGNICQWDATLATIPPGGIGAYGSPCQPDWAKSGEAWTTMYNFPSEFGLDRLTVELSVYERGVIKDLRLTTGRGVYLAEAKECFSPGPLFKDSSGSVPDPSDLQVTMNAAVGDTRSLSVYAKKSLVYLEILCIKMTYGSATSYRFHVETLLDLVVDRPKQPTSTGFCPTGVIDIGKATPTDPDFAKKCLVKFVSLYRLLCMNLVVGGCPISSTEKAVQSWCSQAFPSSSSTCASKILAGTSESAKGDEWGRWYCDSIRWKAELDGIVSSKWDAVCLGTLRSDGPRAFVSRYGLGLDRASCGAGVTHYPPRTLKEQTDACVPGASIEYQNSAGNWVELLFVPTNNPPCGGTLRIPATSAYQPLFTHLIRIRQCQPDHKNPQLSPCAKKFVCERNAKFEATFRYETKVNICPL